MRAGVTVAVDVTLQIPLINWKNRRKPKIIPYDACHFPGHLPFQAINSHGVLLSRRIILTYRAGSRCITIGTLDNDDDDNDDNDRNRERDMNNDDSSGG